MSTEYEIGSSRPTTPRSRRRLQPLLGVIALLVLSGLAALFIVQQVQTQNHVVQVRADVSRGEVITAADLAEVTVGSIAGVSTTPAGQLSSLIGQRAAIDLAAGSLLPAGAVGPAVVPAPGQTLVGLQLEPGRMVVGDIEVGSRVRLIVTAPLNGDPTFKDANSGRQFSATLIHVEAALDGAGTLVNVQVSQNDSGLVAQLAATGRIAVVQDSPR